MKRGIWRGLLPVCVLLMLAGLLTACGGGEETVETPSPQVTQTPPGGESRRPEPLPNVNPLTGEGLARRT